MKLLKNGKASYLKKVNFYKGLNQDQRLQFESDVQNFLRNQNHRS